MTYALSDGASQIRLEANRHIVVFYKINDEWREQMRIPLPVHSALIGRIKSLCERGEHDGREFDIIPVELRDDNVGLIIGFSMLAEFSPGKVGEDVLLQMQPRMPNLSFE